jgi:hypothetical protein
MWAGKAGIISRVLPCSSVHNSPVLAFVLGIRTSSLTGCYEAIASRMVERLRLMVVTPLLGVRRGTELCFHRVLAWVGVWEAPYLE